MVNIHVPWRYYTFAETKDTACHCTAALQDMEHDRDNPTAVVDKRLDRETPAGILTADILGWHTILAVLQKDTSFV